MFLFQSKSHLFLPKFLKMFLYNFITQITSVTQCGIYIKYLIDLMLQFNRVIILQKNK